MKMKKFIIDYEYLTKRDVTIEAETQSEAVRIFERQAKNNEFGSGEATLYYVGELK